MGTMPTSANGLSQSTTPKSKRADQAYMCYEAQKMGMPLREIGKMLGLSHETVRSRITEYCDRLVLPKAEEYRKRMVEQCEHLIESLAKAVGTGDPAAVGATIRAMDRKAKLLGLDAPIQIEATVVQVTQEDQEFAAFIREQKVREAYNSDVVDAEEVDQV